MACLMNPLDWSGLGKPGLEASSKSPIARPEPPLLPGIGWTLVGEAWRSISPNGSFFMVLLLAYFGSLIKRTGSAFPRCAKCRAYTLTTIVASTNMPAFAYFVGFFFGANAE